MNAKLNLSPEMLLAIETATPVCSVSLQLEDGQIYEKRVEEKGAHSEQLFLFVDELLKRADVRVADLEAVLFSKGPGSYTGLRIGAAAIKGLLFGQQKIQLWSFSTLLSFASGVLWHFDKVKGTIHAVADARREHLYWQKLEINRGEPVFVSKPALIELNHFKKEIGSGDVVIGTGWDRLDDLKETGEDLQWIGSGAISATSLITAWRNRWMKEHFKKEDTEQFEPEYLTISQVNNTSMTE